ncbi:MAG: hypothetical protein MUF55_09245 [Hydrogenophaga sp.]|jgi:hypothetical protein|nr:hypothetical protein [Hydrogenophaga sp.]
MSRPALAVFLRGHRDYVQGTQLIARLAEQVAPAGSLLTQATFSRMTANTVCWQAAGQGDAQASIGQVHFVNQGSEHVYQLLDTGVAAPRQDRAMGVRVELEDSPSVLTGRYLAGHPGDLEGLLNVLVQSVKDLHERAGTVVSDVWFTGMRQFAVPVCGLSGPFRGVVDIRQRRLIRRGVLHQSLVEVTVIDHDRPERQHGMVNFAFKSEQPIHVD